MGIVSKLNGEWTTLCVMAAGFMAGTEGDGVAAGDLVNLAFRTIGAFAQSTDAPTPADRGFNFNADARP